MNRPRCVREDPVAVYQTGADGVPLDEEAALRRILVPPCCFSKEE